MTWSATILRGGDDLDVKPFEPVTSAGTILVDSTGETGVTSQTVLRKLASIDNALGVAIQEGSVVQVYNGSAWYDDTPSLAFGPMLVREIACVEHPEQPDLWKVDYMASSFGPILTAESATIGSPQISVGVVSRPRMAAAYRADVTPPADVIATVADRQRYRGKESRYKYEPRIDSDRSNHHYHHVGFTLAVPKLGVRVGGTRRQRANDQP